MATQLKLAIATMMLAALHLASATTVATPTSYCPSTSAVAQLSGTRYLRAPPSHATSVQYSALPGLGWKVPLNRQPNNASRGDFFSVMCNSQNDCTPKAPPYNTCTSQFSGTSCLTVSPGGQKGSNGIGEVRVAYTCTPYGGITFWVLEYLFNYNGIKADFSSLSNWWIQFDGVNNRKVGYSGNGACSTQGNSLNIRCTNAWLVLNGSEGVGVLYELTLPQNGVSSLKMQAHAEWNGATAATWNIPEICFKPCPGVSGDPHFIGAHGTRFDFNGLPGKSFCLLTDANLHVNMELDGYYDKRDFGAKNVANAAQGVLRSWIRELMIMWRANGMVHKFHLTSRSGPSVDYGSGYLVNNTLDGTSHTALQIGDFVEVPSLGFRFQRVDNNAKYTAGIEEVYSLTIGERFQATVHLRPAHRLLQTADDAYVHLSLLLDNVGTSTDVHGVLGQTYRTDRGGRTQRFQKMIAKLKRSIHADGESGKGFLDGTTADYITSNIYTPDCKFTRFEEKYSALTAA